MTRPKDDALSQLFDGVAESLDLTAELYDRANDEYERLGNYLANNGETRGQEWDIYSQGSFRLGTVVRPNRANKEYDLDMVCLTHFRRENTTQTELKSNVGVVLQDYQRLSQPQRFGPDSCEPSRRCWTLGYPGEFHIDVLPAILDLKASSRSAISLTDRKLTEWQPSDPIMYANWFRAEMQREVDERRAMIASIENKSVEAIPVRRVKTTLQRTVQVLKRHRDVYFRERDDERPPSILITTLATHCYSGAGRLFDAVATAADGMPALPKKENRKWTVCSPISEENFADKWNEYPERANAFFEWADRLQRDIDEISEKKGIGAVVGSMSPRFGEGPTDYAAKSLGINLRAESARGNLYSTGPRAQITTEGSPASRRHNFYGEA